MKDVDAAGVEMQIPGSVIVVGSGSLCLKVNGVLLVWVHSTAYVLGYIVVVVVVVVVEEEVVVKVSIACVAARIGVFLFEFEVTIFPETLIG